MLRSRDEERDRHSLHAFEPRGPGVERSESKTIASPRRVVDGNRRNDRTAVTRSQTRGVGEDHEAIVYRATERNQSTKLHCLSRPRVERMALPPLVVSEPIKGVAQWTHVGVVLDPRAGAEATTRSSRFSCFTCGKMVHSGRVVPDEETFCARVGIREVIESPSRHLVVDCLPSRLALELSTHRGGEGARPFDLFRRPFSTNGTVMPGLTGVEVGLQFLLGNEAAGLSVDRLQRANVELLVERHCQNLA